MVIRGITIRGDPNAEEWVTHFKVKYGLTSQAGSYTYYQEPYNKVKVGHFSGGHLNHLYHFSNIGFTMKTTT